LSVAEQIVTPLPRPAQRGRGNFFMRPLTWLFGVLIGTTLIYLPGLNGPFLFDDPPNVVQPLTAWLGGQIGWQEIIFGNDSGPLHRPLAMLTFLANASLSGLSPWPFKATNLAIHLACGVLIYALLSRLLARDTQFKTGRFAALIVSAIWLLHPMQASTVLYVVQRMEQLSALFTLAALLLYVHARQCFEQGHRRSALIHLFVLLPLATLAAILSKENGVLVPLFCLVLELGYFRDSAAMPRPRVVTWFFCVTLLVPGLLALFWFWRHPQQLLGGYAGRLFTPVERLMSEPRALMDYMGALLLPRGPSLGLYTDDFAVSHSLLDPVSTLAAIVGLIALVVAALWSRKYIPAFFVGIGFYLVGHSMESTVIPLELYFEHRNYLPSVGFFLAVVGLVHWAVLRVLPHISNNPLRSRRLLSTGVVLLLLALGVATLARASVWSSWPVLAAQGARQHPDSIRAQMDHATNLMAVGQFDAAQRVIDHVGTIENPAAKHIAAIDTVLLQCVVHHATNPSSVARIAAIQGAKLQLSDMLAFEMLGRELNGHGCQGLAEAQLAVMITEIVDAAPQPGALIQLWRSRYIASNLFMDSGQYVKAEQQVSLAWATGHADPSIGLLLANLEYLNGNVAGAKIMLADANRHIPWWDRRNVALGIKLKQLFENPPPANIAGKPNPQ
jgi:hypothetical protein